jgi:hypothetical protein
MIAPTCQKCGAELDEPGALVFSPPQTLGAGSVVKYHVCADCWQKLLSWLAKR